MRRTVIQPCHACGEPSVTRIRLKGRFFWGKWHWFCHKCIPTSTRVLTGVELPEHPVQEYNVYGNVCHYPGCDKTEEQHPKK